MYFRGSIPSWIPVPCGFLFSLRNDSRMTKHFLTSSTVVHFHGVYTCQVSSKAWCYENWQPGSEQLWPLGQWSNWKSEPMISCSWMKIVATLILLGLLDSYYRAVKDRNRYVLVPSPTEWSRRIELLEIIISFGTSFVYGLSITCILSAWVYM